MLKSSVALTALVVVAVIVGFRNFLVSLGCSRGIFFAQSFGSLFRPCSMNERTRRLRLAPVCCAA